VDRQAQRRGFGTTVMESSIVQQLGGSLMPVEIRRKRGVSSLPAFGRRRRVKEQQSPGPSVAN
jgi:hypothetical protein